VTALERRVATLAAVFTPGRAAAMLTRLDGAGAAAAHALQLSAMPRRERLEALSAALTRDRAEVRARADATASLERTLIAGVVRALADGRACEGASRLVLRLCRERIGY
jgi:hypothetical protein